MLRRNRAVSFSHGPSDTTAEDHRSQTRNTAAPSFLCDGMFVMQWTCISDRGRAIFCGCWRLFRGENQSASCVQGRRCSPQCGTRFSMRGTPWLRFALMTIALALTAIPIGLLMRPAAPPAPANSGSANQEERELTLEVVSAPAAHSIRVSYLGQELIPRAQTGGSYSGTLRVPSSSSADLVVMATWTATETAALRVRVSNDDGPIAEASYWGTDRVQDVFTIPESPQ
jgi:hypothetical protein